MASQLGLVTSIATRYPVTSSNTCTPERTKNQIAVVRRYEMGFGEAGEGTQRDNVSPFTYKRTLPDQIRCPYLLLKV
jgi:hypothetical protein